MSNLIQVKVPDIGDFKNIPVIEVLVKPGDKVEKEDSLITLESDKATMEVPSPAAGIVRELRIKIQNELRDSKHKYSMASDFTEQGSDILYAKT